MAPQVARIEIDIEDEYGVTYGTLWVEPNGHFVLVTLDTPLNDGSVDEWNLGLDEALRFSEMTRDEAKHSGAAFWFDLILDEEEALKLADAIADTVACIKRGWV